MYDDKTDAEYSVEGPIDWLPIAGEFPEDVWCLYYPDRETYVCCALPDDPESFGLVTLSSRRLGDYFIDNMVRARQGKNGCIPALRTFDEARDLAKERDKVQALILMDDPKNPQIHYVKTSND